MFIPLACEQYDSSQPESDTWTRVYPRTVEGCDDCPIDYCCCAIEIWGFTTAANISVCGFSNGNYICGTFDPPGTACPNVSGYGEDIALDYTNLPHVAVCKDKNGVFRIYNNEDYAITIRITCEYNVTSPNWTVINIPEGEDVFYSTSSNCGLALCQ